MTRDIPKGGGLLVSRRGRRTDIWSSPGAAPPAENVRRGVRVTRQTGQVLTPTASPDDKQIAFLSDSGGHANLWVVNTENGGARQNTHERGRKGAGGGPGWAPRGDTHPFCSPPGHHGVTVGVWVGVCEV